ncbi:MAG: threonine/serine dehydratase [Candidatus Dormiibacterota bacterium]
MTAEPRLDEIGAARARVAGVALRSPLLPLHDPDAPGVWLKLENLQPTGSFKIRGATNLVEQLDRASIAQGLLTASAGNMGQAVAWSAQRLGVPCTVIVPDTAARNKTDAVERYGGRVIRVSFDRWWQVFTEKRFDGVSGTFIHPFADQRVMDGNATIGLEIVEDLPDVDVVLIPWGGGGLACGIAAAIRATGHLCRIYACEVKRAAPLEASLAAGRPVAVEYERSFVDGIGAGTVMPEMFDLARELIDGAMVASVEEVEAAVTALFRRNRVVAEGAGACAVAIARSGRLDGRSIACVVSGGNIDAATLFEVISRHQEAGDAVPQ